MTDDFMDQYLTTGGIDDEAVTLRNAKFTTDLAYQDGQVPFLCVDIIPDNPDVTSLEEVRIGVGKGWEASDDEASVERVDGKKAAFHTSSKIGRLLASVGGLDEFRAAAKDRLAKGDMPAPTTAEFWEGLRGVVKNNEEEFTTAEGGTAKFNYYTFTTFDGWEGQTSSKGGAKKAAAKPAKKAAAKKEEAEETAEAAEEAPAEAPKPAKKAAAKKAAAVKEEAAETGGLSLDDFRATLIAHCQGTEADDHSTWLVEAYEKFGDELVAGGDAFQALVDDEAEVWAEVWGG